MADEEHLALLKQGVEVWNEWRQKNPEIIPDLKEATLRKANLSNANLGRTLLNSADLSEAFLQEANLMEADLEEANLVKASFPEANLKKANFIEANLAEADLSRANLNQTNFRGANLIKTKFNQASLVKANLTGAYLVGATLVGTDLTEANFRGANLGGADLGGANLNRSNFTKADLFEADLSGANLISANFIKAKLKRAYLNRANLSRTDLSESDLSLAQAIQANFTGAKLTGTCLEDWNINSATNLEDTICEYVYLRRNQQERFPIDRNFQPGEFTKLFQKASSILELIFHNGVDWIAFSYSLGRLQIEQEEAQLAVRSIESKGDGVVVIKVEVSPKVDKPQIHGQFWKGYEFASQTLEAQYQARLEDKDKQINQLFDLLDKLSDTPKLINANTINQIDQRHSSFGVGVNPGNMNAENVSGTHNEASEKD